MLYSNAERMPNLGIAQIEASISNGRTIVSQQFGKAPLQVHAPLYLNEDYPTVYLRTPCAGLLDGDAHRIEVVVQKDAILEVRTQAATLVYPGRSEQHIDITLSEGAALRFLPHPMILAKGADFLQTIRIVYHTGAKITFAEQWCAGRVAMGETWQFTRFRNRVSINNLFHENFDIAPTQYDLTNALLCGEHTHFKTTYSTHTKLGETHADKHWSMEKSGLSITREANRIWRNS